MKRRAFVLGSVASLASVAVVSAQDATPTPASVGCRLPDASATPAMMDMPYDQMYIDAMIPHHQSVIDLATAAKDQLTIPELQEIAQAILDTQPGEIDKLTALRREWYGDDDITPMSMDLMHGSMGEDPATCSDPSMVNTMSSEWQVETFKKADDKDLAFIDQVLPHHQMAVSMSKAALELAEHKELKEIAQDVIDAQSKEIETLQKIRDEHYS